MLLVAGLGLMLATAIPVEGAERVLTLTLAGGGWLRYRKLLD